MNHSCNPNCQLQKWVVGSQMRIGIYTLKDVPKGAELTFDYKFERYGNEAQPCYCGESVCSGFIGKEQTESTSVAVGSDEELSEEEEDEEESPEHLVRFVEFPLVLTINIRYVAFPKFSSQGSPVS